MQVIYLVLFAVCAGLASANLPCKRYDLEECYQSGISMPSTIEEFNKICPSLISYADCLENHWEPCNGETSMRTVYEGNTDKLKELLQSACNQSSNFQYVISENLPCLKDVLSNSCAWTMDVLKDSVQYLGKEQNLLEYMAKYNCLEKSLYASCISADAYQKCGSMATHLVGEGFKSFGQTEPHCSVETRRQLTEVVPKLDIETQARSVLDAILKEGLVTNTMCEERDYAVCPALLDRFAYPEGSDDILKFCPSVMSYIKCLKNFSDTCGMENSGVDIVYEGRLDKFKKVMVEICDQSSELHKTLTQNLACFGTAMSKHQESCAWTDEVMEDSKQYLRRDKGPKGYKFLLMHQDIKVDGNKYYCLDYALDISCIASLISTECGSDAKQTFLATFDKIGTVEAKCPNGMRGDMLEVIQNLEIRADTKSNLEGMLKED